LIFDFLDQFLIGVGLQFSCLEAGNLKIDIARFRFRRLEIVPCGQKDVVAENYENQQ